MSQATEAAEYQVDVGSGSERNHNQVIRENPNNITGVTRKIGFSAFQKKKHNEQKRKSSRQNQES